MEPPVDLFAYLATGGLIEAWNVSFERHIWEKVCVPRMGWPQVHRNQWRCAMAKARAFALPGALANAASVVHASAQKDPAGTRLLNKFSVPRNPTLKNKRLRLDPATDPEGPALYAYNVQDIVAEAEVSSLVPDLQRDELEWWQVDQEINARGVQIDMESVNAAISVVEETLKRYNGELAVLTNGAVSSASEVQKLTGWLGAYGLHLSSLDEEAVGTALARKNLHPTVRRALEIRALVGSASVKKLFAMEHMVCRDGRLRDLYAYHGARTGRATGGSVQPTNLPNHGPAVRKCVSCGKHFGEAAGRCPWCAAAPPPATQEWSASAMEDAIAVLRSGSLDLTEMAFGPALPAISGCLRGMFVAAPGHDLIASDYSAIEAVVLAELAGEKWRQEVFRTHGKIYEMSASKISGVPFEEMMEHRKRTGQHHPLRKTIGKVAELASGYQGWVGAWKAFGADEFMSEEEMKTAILKWRAESPNIVEFWGGQTRRLPFGGSVQEYYGIEGAAISAVLVSGQEFSHRGVTYFCQGDVLYCRLLSGRYLTYHRPRLEPSQKRFGEHSLSYEGWNTNPKNGPIGWIRMQTWGGRLVENLVQATARDIQREALVRQERAGYKIVLHVYDENVAEVPEGWGSVEEFEMIMSTMPAWAADWPVRAAGGWRGKRYRKD
jgi:DNA polymerase